VNVFLQKLADVATAFQMAHPVSVAHVSSRVISHLGADVAFA